MADLTLNCSDCPNPFIFNDRDQAYFTKQGYAPPKRCPSCREKAKAKREQQASQPPRSQQPARQTFAPEPSYNDRKKDKGRGSRRDKGGGW